MPDLGRRIGLEVEFRGDQGLVMDSFNRAGIGCDTGHYSAQPRERRFMICPDASVQGGAELKSPILAFGVPDDKDLLMRGIQALRAGGAVPDPTAGIHVHIDARGMQLEQLQNVVRFFTKFEDPIYRIASSGWQTMRPRWISYASQLPFDVVERACNAKTMPDFQNTMYSRRSGLNLTSYWSKNTIEFRVFNSSVNHERIWGYIALCHQIVRDACLNQKRSLAKRYPLGSMKSGQLQEEKVRSYFFGVLSKPSASDRQLEGMSKEDLKILAKIWKDSRPQAAAISY